jgi:hypothetical protein
MDSTGFGYSGGFCGHDEPLGSEASGYHEVSLLFDLYKYTGMFCVTVLLGV